MQILDILSKVFNISDERITLNTDTQRQLSGLFGEQRFWMFESLLKCLNGFFFNDDEYKQHLDHLYKLLNTCLNTGHFSEVPELYRLMFSVCCLIQSYILFKTSTPEEALAKCDEGLLKGYELDGDVLGSMGEALSEIAAPLEKLHFTFKPSTSIPPSLQTTRKIQVLDRPSLETFYEECLLPERPIIIKNLLKNMPCYEKWSFEYLYTKCGHRTVPVELGSKYTDDDWSQILMPFGEFVKDYIVNQTTAEHLGYMAQHRLLDQVPSLLKDVIVPDYCWMVPYTEPENINCFIGPANTVSPLHTDPRHNFFFQVRGKKFVRLINPDQKANLYLFDDFLRANSSQVDVEHPDYEKHPNFRNVIVEDYLMVAGDCLFIPQGYFHHIRALEPSISMSIWFGNSKEKEK
ncbi:unnamed protein product [Bursaphelenchus okinawaensis]|uniref:JmjC domain-containing protein n=1 Tax=Bursaphelenchus okinawaensis TaxID=465554 RepID=A0A811LRN7_9BILA|nr:unnamed protein product [Bursaphelenchus okinawaensis]CAG9127209.1 unnamed protein product [Bursaphelenchus okinawaensis]